MHTKKYLKKHENKNTLDRIEFESECFLKNSAFICFSWPEKLIKVTRWHQNSIPRKKAADLNI